ncbi:MAG: DUF262 domain-containing HNH endonuclease family protein [Pirellulales bacterium]|nr:DUF262 domain-containing HNH endonuclease family protein [Pirellulales bacterium]
MAKTILLETRTVTFLELVGNGRQFEIPKFQRDYSWEEEQWDDLWNDVLALRDNLEDRHYMGALVSQPKSDRKYDIIDGQQRLATLTILALAIISQLHILADSGIEAEQNSDRADSLRARFIGEKDPASLVEVSKLTLNETDDPFFQEYLVQLRTPSNPRGLPKSNRLLYQCFLWFSKHLSELISEKSLTGQQIAELLNEVIARRLVFIQINVDDDLNAYTVFETLNARGLELSATDLLKNYLFSKIKTSSDLKSLQRRWQILMGIVKQERFPEFLRYHLLCDQPKIRTSRLFKIVRQQVQNGTQVFQLMNALESRAEIFAALTDESHEYWVENRDAKMLIRERILLKSQQSTPLLFAAKEKMSDGDFNSVLNATNIFTFRYTTVSSLNTNELEPLYHQAAQAILSGRARTPAEVFAILRPHYVEDAQFCNAFELLDLPATGQTKKLAKYILCKLESDASNSFLDYETDPGTIEHIFPQNPLPLWYGEESNQEWSKQVDRLANLTLLEAFLNREVANLPYIDKVPVYARSGYRITQALAAMAPNDWTIAHLEKRQSLFAERAVHIWRVDY